MTEGKKLALKRKAGKAAAKKPGTQEGLGIWSDRLKADRARDYERKKRGVVDAAI